MAEHGERRVLHFNATFNPTAAWAIQQLREAFSFDTTPSYLIFDGDATLLRMARGSLSQHLSIVHLASGE